MMRGFSELSLSTFVKYAVLKGVPSILLRNSIGNVFASGSEPTTTSLATVRPDALAFAVNAASVCCLVRSTCLTAASACCVAASACCLMACVCSFMYHSVPSETANDATASNVARFALLSEFMVVSSLNRLFVHYSLLKRLHCLPH